MDIKSLIIRAGGWLSLSPVPEQNESGYSQDQMLDEAHQALVQAQNLFSRVDDPDMIEYAIYTMKAAEERYDFLIRSMKASRQEKACL